MTGAVHGLVVVRMAFDARAAPVVVLTASRVCEIREWCTWPMTRLAVGTIVVGWRAVAEAALQVRLIVAV